MLKDLRAGRLRCVFSVEVLGEQPTVQRYINHQAQGSRVLLFVRERKYDELGTQPFYFLGPVSYVDHRGEKPVSFTWRLPQPMPEELFEVARSVAAA